MGDKVTVCGEKANEMQDTPEPNKRESQIARTRCFSLIVCFTAVVVLLIVAIFQIAKWRENVRRESVARQIAEIRRRKTDCLYHPDPKFLDASWRQDRECAQQLTTVELGERFPPDYPENRYTALTSFPRLNTVTVSYTGGADAFLGDIEGMASLEELSFYRAGISAVGARRLTSFPNLKRLRLYDRAESAIDVLKNDARIEELSLGDEITPTWVAVLKTLPNLRALELRIRLQDSHSLDFRGLGKLERLGLGGDGVTDDALVGLEEMPNLATLSLNESMVTDAGLGHLAKLIALQKLHLHETQISDDGLKYLTGLAKLRELDLRTTRVTDGGVKEIQQALPGCKIDR